jgi:hypothetical protein
MAWGVPGGTTKKSPATTGTRVSNDDTSCPPASASAMRAGDASSLRPNRTLAPGSAAAMYQHSGLPDSPSRSAS